MARAKKAPEVRQLPEEPAPGGFRYEPMKPLTKEQAREIARQHWHPTTSADYLLMADNSENASRLLMIKAKNSRMIAAALKELKR